MSERAREHFVERNLLKYSSLLMKLFTRNIKDALFWDTADAMRKTGRKIVVTHRMTFVMCAHNASSHIA